MNKICIKQINIDNKYSIDAFFIDGKPLYEYLENSYRSFYNSEPKKPLAPMQTLAVAWTDDYDYEGDSDFVKFLLKLDHVNLPILSCPDDMDFSCTVLVAEVTKKQNSILWKKIGIVNQAEWSFDIEKAHGILFLEAYTDDDWDKYGDNIALAEIDSPEWCDWISRNWREELYRRRVNYTYPEYQKDENIDWFFECNWVFDKNEYDSVVQNCYDKTMI